MVFKTKSKKKFLKRNKGTKPAYNRTVYASPPYGGSGSEKPQSGFALCAVLSPPQFGQGSMLRIAL